MVKTILYCVMKLEQKRVFQNIESYGDKNIRQVFLGLNGEVVFNSKFKSNIDYSDFKIEEKILCKDKFDLRKIASSIKPDVFVSGSSPTLEKISLPTKCKKVHVSHGIVGKHMHDVKSIRTQKTFDSWNGADLYCGGGDNFERWIKNMPGHKPGGKFIKNAIPQFDIVHNNIENNEYRDFLASQNKIPKADKYILFGGFGGFTREDFLNHNEDYYRTAIYLDKISKKNNWFTFIKPRLGVKQDHAFVKTNKDVMKYADDYIGLWKSDNVCMVNRLESIYKYYFSDIMVVNGTSTMEIEMCSAAKPIVIVRSAPGEIFDPLSTVSIGGVKLVNSTDMVDLEEAVNGSFEKNIASYGKVLSHHEITSDGKMSERVSNAILELL